MNKKLNGTLKYLGVSGSAVAVLATMMFGMVRHSQSQMSIFSDDYDKRIVELEKASVRAEEQRKYIIKMQEINTEALKRIEAKFDAR